MKGIIDNVKIRIRTHCPNEIIEKEFEDIQSAIDYIVYMR